MIIVPHHSQLGFENKYLFIEAATNRTGHLCVRRMYVCMDTCLYIMSVSLVVAVCLSSQRHMTCGQTLCQTTDCELKTEDVETQDVSGRLPQRRGLKTQRSKRASETMPVVRNVLLHLLEFIWLSSFFVFGYSFKRTFVSSVCSYKWPRTEQRHSRHSVVCCLVPMSTQHSQNGAENTGKPPAVPRNMQDQPNNFGNSTLLTSGATLFEPSSGMLTPRRSSSQTIAQPRDSQHFTDSFTSSSAPLPPQRAFQNSHESFDRVTKTHYPVFDHTSIYRDISLPTVETLLENTNLNSIQSNAHGPTSTLHSRSNSRDSSSSRSSNNSGVFRESGHSSYGQIPLREEQERSLGSNVPVLNRYTTRSSVMPSMANYNENWQRTSFNNTVPHELVPSVVNSVATSPSLVSALHALQQRCRRLEDENRSLHENLAKETRAHAESAGTRKHSVAVQTLSCHVC